MVERLKIDRHTSGTVLSSSCACLDLIDRGVGCLQMTGAELGRDLAVRSDLG